MKTTTIVSPKLTRPFVLFAFRIALALPPAAFAHAKLMKSTPADKSTVAEAPKTIDLWFDELLDAKFNSIEVYASSEVSSKKRTNLAEKDAKVDEKDKTHLTVALKAALAPGDYTVEWRVLSRDGHSAPGKFVFKVAAPK